MPTQLALVGRMTRMAGRFSRARERRRRGDRRKSFTLERLEERTLLSITISGYNPAAGTVTFTGDGAGDRLILSELPSPDLPGDRLVLATNLPNDPGKPGDLNSPIDLDPSMPGDQELVIGQGTSPMITVNFSAGGVNTLELDNSWNYGHPLTMNGGGADTLRSDSSGTITWTLNGGSAGRIGSNLTFTGLAALVGGSGDDTFNILATTGISLDGGGGFNNFVFSNGAVLKGSIDGIDAFDTLDFTAYTSPLAVTLTSGVTGNGVGGSISGSPDPISGGFFNIRSILTSSGKRDTLIGENAERWWFLGGTNRYGDLTHAFLVFSGFDTLIGGNGDDTFYFVTSTGVNIDAGAGTNDFVFSDGIVLTGSITGSGGTNTLDLTNYTTPLSVTLTSGSSAGVGGFISGSPDPISKTFSDIGSILTTSGIGDSLTGENADRTWNLDVSDTYGDGTATFLTFSGFDVLTGGSGDDTFNILTATTANLNGGSGTNQFVFADGVVLDGSIDSRGSTSILDLSQIHGATSVDLATGYCSVVDGTLSGVPVIVSGTGTNNVTGDASNDTYYSDGTADTFVGGGGSDTFSLTLQAGSSTRVTASQGDNTLDFSRATAGIALDLDSTQLQTVSTGRQLQLTGEFTTVIGSPFSNTFDVTAGLLPRTIIGGTAGSTADDTLQVDAGGRVAVVTPTQVLVEGLGAITYSHFSNVIVVDQALSDLALSQTSSPVPTVIDGTLVIVLTVSDGGPSTATQVVLSDVIPTSMEFVSATPSQGSLQVSSGILTANLGSLAVGRKQRCGSC